MLTVRQLKSYASWVSKNEPSIPRHENPVFWICRRIKTDSYRRSPNAWKHGQFRGKSTKNKNLKIKNQNDNAKFKNFNLSSVRLRSG